MQRQDKNSKGPPEDRTEYSDTQETPDTPGGGEDRVRRSRIGRVYVVCVIGFSNLWWRVPGEPDLGCWRRLLGDWGCPDGVEDTANEVVRHSDGGF